MVNFTFVSHHSADGRSRRVQTRTACASCRSKKRRCSHQLTDSTLSEPSAAHQPRRVRLSPADITTDGLSHRFMLAQPAVERTDKSRSNHQQRQNQSNANASLLLPEHHDEGVQHVNSESTPQFFGDLNPAARLLDEAEQPNERSDNLPYEVGVWVQPRTQGDTNSSQTSYPNASTPRRRPTQQFTRGVSDLIAFEDAVALSDLYFAKIHPILPILDEQDYRDALQQRKISMALVHVVCLVAAKDIAAGPNLRLLESLESSVSVRAFCSKLYTSVTAAVTHTSQFQRITLVRVLGLLSQHQEGSTGSEQASGYLTMACHHAQTLAMHLRRPGNSQNLEMKKIFWCLWTLDRLNAATNSRPCIFNDVDIGVDEPEQGELGSAAFDIWFQISKILNRAIALYRPVNPESMTGIDLGYSGFEQLIDQMHGWTLPISTLATLRIFFLATAVLSYRLKTIKILPATTIARLWQQIATTQIIRQLQDHDHLDSLHPLPVVVYGVSLALSVSYQQVRFSRLSMDQQEALHDLKTSCSILQKLRQKWSMADAMASLAQKVSIELEKVPDLSIVNTYRPPQQIEAPERLDEAPASEWGVEPTHEGEYANNINNLPRNEDTGLGWDTGLYDLFGGMDDMSWMYLAAENPISFDNFPDLATWDEASEQPVLQESNITI